MVRQVEAKMRIWYLFLGVLVLVSLTRAQTDDQEGWNAIVNSPDTFWGHLMGWGSTQVATEETSTEIATSLPIISTTSPLMTAIPPNPLNSTALEPLWPTGMITYESDRMSFWEKTYYTITIVLPNVIYITNYIFLTWVHVFFMRFHQWALVPVTHILATALQLPVKNGLYDITGGLTKILSILSVPVVKTGQFLSFNGRSENLLRCMGSAVLATKDLLLAIFQVIPGCLAEVTPRIFQIIIDAMWVIENLSTVYITVMETLNVCIGHPILCVLSTSLKAILELFKATTLVAYSTKALIQLLPSTGDALATCLITQSSHLAQQLPRISDRFLCRL